MTTATAAAPLAYAARPEPRAANDNEGLIIDLFAGGGGASEAIFEVTGRHPDIAVNHDEEAIALHAVNHPTTLHLCDDIRQVNVGDTLALPQFRGRFVDLLWASPDCKDHSKAKGGKPKDKNIRGLAWEVLRWAAAIRRATGRPPSIIALENVEEFADWGPIHTQGKNAGRVQKKRRKELFRLWVQQLESLGFRVEHRELVAANFGAPTTRKRLFLIARSDGGAIRWPSQTHSKIASAGDLFADQLDAWKPAAGIIDWSLPIPSIFGRRRPLKPKTHRRLAKGIKRFVIEAARPFIVPVTHMAADRAPMDIDDPLGVVTTAKGGEFAVAAPTMMPVNHGGEDERAYSAEEPVKTITAAPRGEQAIGVPYLVPRYGERDGQEPRALDATQPYPTVVPDQNGGSIAVAHITKFSENSTGTDPSDPLHTAMAGAPRHGLVAAHLQRQFGTTVSGRDLESPHPAVMSNGGGGKSQVVAATLDRQFGKSAGAAADEPVGTITAGGMGKTNLVAVHMDQHNGDRVGRPADDPLSVITHRATQQKIAAATLQSYYTNEDGTNGVDEPLRAVTSKDRFSTSAAFLEQANTGMVGHSVENPMSTIVGGGDSGWGATQRLIEAVLSEADGGRRRDVLAFLWEHFGTPTEAEIADPLATAQGRLRFGLVVVEGVVYQIVDIGMRMLTPRELYSAQGFAPHYVIDITLANGKPLTKTAQTRMAGNSVSPPPARALLRANLPERLLMKRAA